MLGNKAVTNFLHVVSWNQIARAEYELGALVHREAGWFTRHENKEEHSMPSKLLKLQTQIQIYLLEIDTMWQKRVNHFEKGKWSDLTTVHKHCNYELQIISESFT